MKLLKKMGAAAAAGSIVVTGSGLGWFLAAEKAGGKVTDRLFAQKGEAVEKRKREVAIEIDKLKKQRLETVKIISRDGLRLKGHLFRAKKKHDRVALCVHGYKSNGLREYRKLAWMFHDMGYDVLMVDDRGHGASEGTFIGFGCLEREDLYQWIRFLTKAYGPDSEIILHGVSMGAASVLMTLDLNLPAAVKAVIADCGYSSVSEQMAYVMKNTFHVSAPLVRMAGEWFSKHLAGYDYHTFSPMNSLTQAKLPVLLIHGTEDHFVPTWMGKANYAACASELKELYLVPGAGHAQCYEVDPEGYLTQVKRFLAKAAAGEHKRNVKK